MKKVTVMSDSETHELAETYADYVFRPGEKSIFSVFGSREKILLHPYRESCALIEFWKNQPVSSMKYVVRGSII